jgi:DNA-directed RNA polymerase specialized sigma24 family protein
VARKMLLAHRRKELQATAIVVGLHELWTDAESPIGATEYAETARLIGIAIARLDSPRDRELLRCHYGLDGQRSPIRADIGLNPSGYRKALERARRRIRPILEQLGVSSAIAMHK